VSMGFEPVGVVENVKVVRVLVLGMKLWLEVGSQLIVVVLEDTVDETGELVGSCASEVDDSDIAIVS
jgi:hypothetical protein